MADQQLHEWTLLRHGQSVGNREGFRQGQREYPLTDLGRSQVQALLGYWREIGRTFDLIVSSPLQRALDTATILGTGLQVPIEQDPDWMERHGGTAEGRPLEDRARLRDRYLQTSVYEPIFAEGESILDLHLRAVRAIQSLLSRPPASYLVVSHGGIMNAALRPILGLAPSGAPPSTSFHFSNTGYMDLSYSRTTRSWKIHCGNVCTHLERTGLEQPSHASRSDPE